MYKKSFLVGGLLTKGIKAAYKAYRKAGGKKTTDIMKSGVKGAGKRSDAKDDLRAGIKIAGGSNLSTREKLLLKKRYMSKLSPGFDKFNEKKLKQSQYQQRLRRYSGGYGSDPRKKFKIGVKKREDGKIVPIYQKVKKDK